MAHLCLDDVTYTFRGRASPAVDHVTLSLSPGIYGLMGINGAGKTTTLRLIARLLTPQSGSITLDGVDLHRSARGQLASRIGYLPQSFALPPRSRVLDALTHLAWLKGIPASSARARAGEVVDRVGLTQHAATRVSELSGGTYRRLGFAQALLVDSEVLLLDEPTTGLDAEQRAAVRELLAKEISTDAVTLVSSHILEDLEVIAPQVIVIDQGSVVFSGKMLDFRRAPDGTLESAEQAFLRALVRPAP